MGMTLPDWIVASLGGDVELWAAATAVVFIGVVARLYFGSVLFHPRHTHIWNFVRRFAVPLLQQVVYRHLPINVAIENHSEPNEYVGTVDETARGLALAIDGVREVEVPLLNGLKTSPDGRTESGTFVFYTGGRPPWAPRWLRAYQVDFTTFDREDGRVDVYAHYEANAYRPDLAIDHLTKGPSFSAQKGVDRARAALTDAGIEYQMVDQPAEADA